MKTASAILLLLLFASHSSLFALVEETPPLYVDVQANAKDSLGERLVYKIKELIRKSSRLTLTETEFPRMTVFVSTMPLDNDDPNLAIIYSVIWTGVYASGQREIYLNSQLGKVGSSKLEGTAEGIAAETDRLMSPKLNK